MLDRASVGAGRGAPEMSRAASAARSSLEAGRVRRCLDGCDVRLVDCDDPSNGLEDGHQDLCVAREAVGGVWSGPATGLPEPSGVGEVVQRDDGLDAALSGAVDEAPVVGDGGAGDLAGSWFDAGPLDAEAVGVQAELGHEVEVFGPPGAAAGGNSR